MRGLEITAMVCESEGDLRRTLTNQVMTNFNNSFSKEQENQALSFEELQAINGAGWVKDALEWVGERADKTVAFYAGWAGAVSGGASWDKGAYDAGVNAGIISGVYSPPDQGGNDDPFVNH
jgi:hypothetical protein